MKKFWNDTLYINSIEKNESIVGILNPICWNKNGEIKQFSIYSTDEEDFIIEGYPKKQKLMRMLNKRVLAEGKVRIDENEVKFIKIKNIKELSGPGSPVNSFIRPPGPSLWNEEYSLSIPKEYALGQFGQAYETFWEAC